MNNDSSFKRTDKRSRVINNHFSDNISILHVDDEEAFLKVTKIYLEDMGGGKLKIDSLINPEHVFRALQEKKYDVIVADYRMVPIDGLQLLNQLRDKNITTPYIILTGHGREEVAIEALNLGANRYIKKGMDTESQFSELLHAIQDTVHHKRIRDALEESERRYRESEERFRRLSEASFEGIVIHDKGRILDVNQAYLSMLGYSHSEFATLDGLSTLIPDDRERVRDIVLSGSEEPYKAQAIKKDGSTIPVEVRGRSIPFKNKIVRVGSIRDMSESVQANNALRESEKKYRNLFETTREGIITSGHDGKVIYINPAAVAMLGYTDQKELIGTLTTNLWMYPKQRALLFRELKEKDYVDNREIVGKKKDGTVFNGLLSLYTHKDEEGNILLVDGLFRDITDRKQAELALRESEEKFRLLGENVLVGLAIIQEDQIVFGNDAYFRIIGFPREEVLNRNPREFLKQIHPEDLAFVQDQLEKRLLSEKAGYVPHYKFRWFTKSKQLKWIEAMSKSIHYHGQPAILAAYNDISLQKQADEEIRESEERLRDFINSANYNFSLFDSKLNFVEINESSRKMIGLPKDEIIGKNIVDLNPKLIGSQRIQHYFEVIKTGQSFDTEVEFKDRIFTVRVFKAGRGMGMVSTDITEYKQAEMVLINEKERAQRFLDVAGVSIISLNKEGIVTLINKKGCEILGYPAEEIIGKEWFDSFLPKELSVLVREVFHELIAGNIEVAEYYENPVLTKNGEKRLMGWYNTLLYDEEGLITGTLTSGEDITERKQAEKELLLVNKELRDFASIVAHDLKAPLRNIANLVEWCVRDSAKDLSEEGKDNLNLMVKQTAHMDALIDGIYRYSKINHINFKIDKINLNELLSEVIDILSPPDNIEIIIPSELPMLAVDKTHMIQIFTNLIDNAVKFMDKPKGHITINYEDKQTFWQFSVADNGPGIKERHFERIFELFQTLSTRDEAKGTGIGLAIVKKVVELNGGKIWLESTVGEGSTFYFTLPNL